MTILATLPLLWAMTSAEAVATLLNSPSSCGVKTYATAMAIVEKDASAGKPLQQFVFGLTSKDRARAKACLDAARPKIRQLAEQKDNPMAWYLLSMEKNDFKMLRRAADGGNVQALNALGTIATSEAFSRNNITSNELENILSQSLDYFRRAAAKRDPNGFINLGTCYLRGFGCDPDKVLAAECFMAAAEAGHPEGMDNLSACYQFGHGVPKDDALSLLWAMRAKALRGDEAAARWLKERK